jgi:hypothetical protein
LLRILSSFALTTEPKFSSFRFALARGPIHFEENDMNRKKIAWLFLIAVAVLAVPTAKAQTPVANAAGWMIDGTAPPPEPIPFPS